MPSRQRSARSGRCSAFGGSECARSNRTRRNPAFSFLSLPPLQRPPGRLAKCQHNSTATHTLFAIASARLTEMHLIRGCSFQHLEAACLETQDQRELWHVDISLSGFSFSSCTSHLHSSLTSHATPVSAWCKKKKKVLLFILLTESFFFSLRCWITFTYGLVFKFRAELFFLFSCAARSCWPHIGHVRSAYASEHLYIACFFFRAFLFPRVFFFS